MTNPRIAMSGLSVLIDENCPPGKMYGINTGSSWWRSATEGAPAASSITIDEIARAAVNWKYDQPPQPIVVSQSMYDHLRRLTQERPKALAAAVGLPDVCKGPHPAMSHATYPHYYDPDLDLKAKRSKRELRELVREYHRRHVAIIDARDAEANRLREALASAREEMYAAHDELDKVKKMLVDEVGLGRLGEILTEDACEARTRDFLGVYLYEEVAEADGE